MTLTYPQALDALARRGRFGIRLGLGRTRALLHELGSPETSVSSNGMPRSSSNRLAAWQYGHHGVVYISISAIRSVSLANW